MINRPTVSVVVPTVDRPAVRTAVLSALSQTSPPLEVIVAVDRSDGQIPQALDDLLDKIRVVFTGGIGEHSQEIRKRVCEGLAFLGLSEGDPAGKVRAIHTEEEKQIARHCRALLRAEAG